MSTIRTAKQVKIKIMSLAEYNALPEIDPTVQYYIHDASSSLVDVMTAPSEVSSSYSMIFPNNLVQMGGVIEVGTLGAGVASGNTPVVLPVTLANSNFVPSLTVITDGTFKQIIADASNLTATGFDVCVRNTDTEQADNVKIAWSVVGTAAV